METQAEYILQGINLKKSFFIKQREMVIFDNLNIKFPKGKIIVITGRSGVGKSTLLNLLGGLDQPTNGSIVFENIKFDKLSNSELAELRRRKIGVIFQNFNLLSSWTAFENVEAVLLHSEMDEKTQFEKIRTLLSEMGLGDRLDNLPAELSVGQQQRVAIARTLINEPQLILADEPSGDVDLETADEIIDRLITNVKQKGTTLIVATHGAFPLHHADEVYLLKEGALSRKEKVS